jgi:hypothetical protein
MLQPSVLAERFSSVLSSVELFVRQSLRQSPEGDVREASRERIVTGFTDALADYVAGAVDLTGDPLLPQPTAAALRSLVVPLFSVEGRTTPDGIGDEMQARVNAAWVALFPLSFALVTPPPGAVQKTSSTAPVPGPPLDLSAIYAGRTPESFTAALAGAFHASLSATPHVVLSLVATPTGPVPAPPLTGFVR